MNRGNFLFPRRKTAVNSAAKKNSSRATEDRLSQLPDEMLLKILSFLDVRFVVQTCFLLSKRWRNIWASLPVLNLDDSSSEDLVSFENFVHSFMSARDSSSNIYKLRLECENELEDHEFVDSIIDYVTDTPSISTTIQVLTISVESVVTNLPELSVCHSLSVLNLSYIATETTNFDIPSLKKLILRDCRFECGMGDSLDLFEECVNLQYLYFHSCVYYGDVKSFIISAPQLIQLDISGFRVDEMFDEDCEIELVTPMLKYFKYDDSNLYSFSSDIDLNFVEKIDMDDEEDTDPLYRLIELFEILGQAKFISFSTEIIQVLSRFPEILEDQSSPFTRMQTFELINGTTSGIPSVVQAYLFGETS
ncbi:hypothetical protein PHAVU_008G272100 [Phaseolus vulgaris]|uniref:F-box domain-containing protein n=1 Tax=Phaseolus vulgaris TaxID=3885 RepID=V7BBU2_PHAVU|nr:hypothetical protein PHAVU_008G272100g [Phaseolus vulgaris]ESW14333.1 hypothetical protein PHAVU_008G272100g [Phaseolus vulgaris]